MTGSGGGSPRVSGRMSSPAASRQMNGTEITSQFRSARAAMAVAATIEPKPKEAT